MQHREIQTLSKQLVPLTGRTHQQTIAAIAQERDLNKLADIAVALEIAVQALYDETGTDPEMPSDVHYRIDGALSDAKLDQFADELRRAENDWDLALNGEPA